MREHWGQGRASLHIRVLDIWVYGYLCRAKLPTRMHVYSRRSDRTRDRVEKYSIRGCASRFEINLRTIKFLMNLEYFFSDRPIDEIVREIA